MGATINNESKQQQNHRLKTDSSQSHLVLFQYVVKILICISFVVILLDIGIKA